MKSPQELWPWIGARWAAPRLPTPRPRIERIPRLSVLENLPFRQRLAFYRKHQDAIRNELAQIRGPQPLKDLCSARSNAAHKKQSSSVQCVCHPAL